MLGSHKQITKPIICQILDPYKVIWPDLGQIKCVLIAHVYGLCTHGGQYMANNLIV